MTTSNNWVHQNEIKESKQRAKKVVKETNASHEGMHQVTIPHPTLKKTFIIKFIKDEK